MHKVESVPLSVPAVGFVEFAAAALYARYVGNLMMLMFMDMHELYVL